MNAQFRNYTTQTAFTISMSSAAIVELQELVKNAPKGQNSFLKYGKMIGSKNVEAYLLRRGLIERPAHSDREFNSIHSNLNWIPTKAGYLVAELLEEAGFKQVVKENVEVNQN